MDLDLRTRWVCCALLITMVAVAAGCEESYAPGNDGGSGHDGVSGDRGANSDAVFPSGPCHTVQLQGGKQVCLPQKLIYDPAKAPKPITSAFPESLPLSVDHMGQYLTKYCPSVHDQGKCGWTVPHSVTAAMEAEYCKTNSAELLLSPPHLWLTGGNNLKDCTGEWSVLTAFKLASSNFLVDHKTWPYDDNLNLMVSTKPADATLTAKGQQQIKNYLAVEAKSVINLKTALHKGYNVVYTVPVFQGMGWSKVCSGQNWSDGDVRWSKPAPSDAKCTKSSKPCKKPDYDDDLNKCRCDSSSDCPGNLRCVANRCADGWQAVLITGYDNKAGGWFTFKNSWSDDWGKKGYGRLSYALVAAIGQGGLFPDALTLRTVCAKPVCVAKEKKCDASGNNVLQCQKDGCGWTAYQNCQCGCASGACKKQACTPSANKQCDPTGKIVQKCKPDGCGLTNLQTCPCACSNGACTTALCNPGALKCDSAGKKLMECGKQGCTWTTLKTCGCTCNGKACAGPSCTPNQKRCDAAGKGLEVCQPDGCGWTKGSSCKCGCANGTCKAQVCPAGTKQCDASGKAVLQCKTDGCGWNTLQQCGCGCSGGKCTTQACTPFSYKCNGSNQQQCQANGCGWTNKSYCDCGCVGGACKSKVCTPLAKQCLGTKLQQCNGTGCGWTTIKDCGACGCTLTSCKTMYYADKDGDTFGDKHSIGQCLNGPSGIYKVTNNTDCNDNDKNMHPAVTDLWDVIDNNCNNKVDEQGLSVWHRWHRAWSAIDWEHRFASTSPGAGWIKEAGWLKIYPKTVCANSTYSSKTCYVASRSLYHQNKNHIYGEAIVRNNVKLDALGACTGRLGAGGSGGHTTFYLLMKASEYWDYKHNYNNKGKFNCAHVGFVMSSVVAGLAPGSKGFYRLQSCYGSLPGPGCARKDDELWSTQKSISTHPTYKPYFTYIHWYAPDGN